MFNKNAQHYSPIQVYSDLIGVGYAIVLLAAGASMLQKIVGEVYAMTETTGNSTVKIIKTLTGKIVEA